MSQRTFTINIPDPEDPIRGDYHIEPPTIEILKMGDRRSILSRVTVPDEWCIEYYNGELGRWKRFIRRGSE